VEVLDVNIRIEVREPTDVAFARRKAAELAARSGLLEVAAANLAIVVTEAATNLLKHSGGGELLLGRVRNSERHGLGVVAIDSGPGMQNVAECLRDGYSTAGSPGTGLGAVSRLAGSIDLYAPATKGTVLAATVWMDGGAGDESAQLQVGGLCLPTAGEDQCGDAWAIRSFADHAVVLLVDGLGHGPGAAAAAQETLRAFERSTNKEPGEVLEDLHAALRSTRGAAVALARLHFKQRNILFSGIGNISAAVCNRDNAMSHNMVSMNGILGHQVARIRQFSYEWPEHSLVIMHSDGLTNRWDLSSYPGLTRRPSTVIASVLYRDYGRKRDDATVVVARQRQSA
jgi:anti-sigma regulatory factor (Ser/Thr protein kinase)